MKTGMIILLLAVVLTMLGTTFSFMNPSINTRVKSSTIVMDGKTRILRDRIKSVKSTQRITEAMRLVAAARVRRAQEAVLKSRPLATGVSEILRDLVKSLNMEDLQLPILEVRDVKKVALVVIAGDRGLCGAYNSQVIKTTNRRIAKLQEQGIDVQLYLIGRKTDQFYSRKNIATVAQKFPLGNTVDISMGSLMSDLLIAQFIEKDIDAAEIIYTRFNNLISSTPSIRTILPLSLSGIESEEDEVFKMTTSDGQLVIQKDEEASNDSKKKESNFVVTNDYIFDEDPANILNTCLNLYFSATVVRCIQESIASELASRMTAMQSACNNAKKINSSLSQRYNRARQAAVTQEMLEIVAGAGM